MEIYIIELLCYWLVVEPYPSEKSEFVSWDDEIPNIMEYKIFQTTNQVITIYIELSMFLMDI